MGAVEVVMIVVALYLVRHYMYGSSIADVAATIH